MPDDVIRFDTGTANVFLDRDRLALEVARADGRSVRISTGDSGELRALAASALALADFWDSRSDPAGVGTIVLTCSGADFDAIEAVRREGADVAGLAAAACRGRLE